MRQPLGVRPWAPAGGLFGNRSEWKRNISRARLHPRSSALVAGLAEQVRTHYGAAAFNVTRYNNAVYTVGTDTPRADVIWDGTGPTPPQLYDPTRGAHFTDVPIPACATAAAGTDAQLTIYDPTHDQLWEFWQAHKQPDGWHARWGGRIDEVSTAPGYFPDGTGSSATGLATSAGLVQITQARAGRINHALALAVVDTDDTISWPAQRTDGSNPDRTPDRIPEGLRLRLKSTADLTRLHPLAQLIGQAAQTYGFIVTDKAGAVSVIAENGTGLQAQTGVDPWADLMAGTPDYLIMQGFPWDQMEALPVDYCKP